VKEPVRHSAEWKRNRWFDKRYREDENAYLPPFVGVFALAAGIVLLVVGSRKGYNRR
jgi:hypothetical protein